MNKNQENSDQPSKLAAGLVGLLAIIADIITIGVFLFQVVLGNIKNISEIISFNAIIITLFGIAISLILYSKSEVEIINKASKFISLYYIFASAFVVIYLSTALTFDNINNFGEFISYISIASMYSFFGNTIYPLKGSKRILSYPYLVTIAIQISILLIRVLSVGVVFSNNLFGLIFLMGLTGFITIKFLKTKN